MSGRAASKLDSDPASILLPLLAAAIQLAAAILVLGRPDPARALDFFASTSPNAADALAAASLLVWGLIGAVCTFVGLRLVADALTTPAVRRRFWEGAVLFSGLLLLAAGAVRHVSAEPSYSGGSVQEAERVLGP